LFQAEYSLSIHNHYTTEEIKEFNILNYIFSRLLTGENIGVTAQLSPLLGLVAQEQLTSNNK
jgi:hypothetical protein